MGYLMTGCDLVLFLYIMLRCVCMYVYSIGLQYCSGYVCMMGHSRQCSAQKIVSKKGALDLFSRVSKSTDFHSLA